MELGGDPVRMELMGDPVRMELRGDPLKNNWSKFPKLNAYFDFRWRLYNVKFTFVSSYQIFL